MNKQEMMTDTHVVEQSCSTSQALVLPISMSNRTFDVLLFPYMPIHMSAISPVAKARGTITVHLAQFQGLPANNNYFTSVTASHSLIVYLHKPTEVAYITTTCNAVYQIFYALSIEIQ